jgi:uncharacterized protein YicC (UPF0701 family)
LEMRLMRLQRYGVRGVGYLWTKSRSMIRSMTGYGKASGTIGSRRYTVEIRSLNGKQLDLSVRMPSAFREREMDLRKLVGTELVRGKSDLTISYEQDEGEARSQVNEPVVRAYIDQIRSIARSEDVAIGDPIAAALRLPDAVQQAREEVNESTWAALDALVAEALAGLDGLLEARLDRVKSRIYAHLEEAMQRGRIDENRFEQEVLFYLEKMDVSEERVRLRAHLALFHEILDGEAGQGKKLGFVAQEIGREVNTLGWRKSRSRCSTCCDGCKGTDFGQGGHFFGAFRLGQDDDRAAFAAARGPVVGVLRERDDASAAG